MHKVGEDANETLRSAYKALEANEAQAARQLAQSVLIAAKSSSDIRLEAHALTCLAHCDRVASRLRRASETSRKAARLFERVSEKPGEASALALLAHVSMLLGRNDEAVEAALLCMRLSDPERPDASAVVAHNCLGVAYGWGGNFARAQEALEEAIRIASRCSPPINTYSPRLNLAWVEASRLAEERYQRGEMPATDRLKALLADCRRFEANTEGAQTPSLMATDGAVAHVLQALLACWQSRPPEARLHADQAIRSLSGTVTWLDALAHWAVGELAWAERDWPSAEVALREMKTMALAVEHERLACVGHLLTAQVFEAQGKHESARMELRALRQRERRLAGESLAAREALVAWQMGARLSAQNLQKALIESKRFQQWSLEDGLTGIANRRRFEQALAQRFSAVAQSGRRLTVAMIDVDRFKSINDTYGHQAGDKVLKAIAAVLSETVRDNDLPARLAGDEFVVLFDDAGPEVGEEIGQRIRDAIARYDWSTIAPSLAVSVSIGVADAAEGDTVETLLLRSDRSMYTVKPGWAPTNF